MPVVLKTTYDNSIIFSSNFAKKIKAGFGKNNQEEVDLAFENLKKLFKFTGILTIIIVGIYLLAFVFGSLAGGGGF